MTEHNILAPLSNSSIEGGVQLSPEEAKQMLLAPPTAQLTVTEAKEALLSNTPYGVVQDKKNKLNSSVLKKQQLLGNNTKGLSLDGIPYAFLSNENKQHVLTLRQEEQQANQQRIQREKRSFLTDQQADTFVGGAANTVVKAGASIAQVFGETFTAGSSFVNALATADLNEKDYTIYRSILSKRQSGETLTPEEMAFEKPTTKTNEFGKEVTTRVSKFSSIEEVGARNQFINKISSSIDSAHALANNKKTEEALAQLKANSIKAVEEFGGDKLFGSIGTFLNGFSDMASEHPAATLELTAQSLPQMYVLAKNALLGVSTLTAAGYDEAVREFVKEHDRQPNQQEKAIAGILALGAAGLDAVGAKAVLGGKDLIKSVLGLSKEVGIKTAKATVEAAELAAQEASKSLLKKSLGITKKVVTSRPVRSVPIEGGTEGIQNILTQLAAKQDLSKVDIAEALVDTTIGGISGAHISTAIVTGEGIAKIPAGLQKQAQELNEQLGERFRQEGIGEAKVILAQAEKDKDPKLALEAVSTNFKETVREDRVSNLKRVDTLITQHEKTAKTKKAKEENVQYRAQLNQLAQAHNRIEAGGSILQAVQTVTDTKKVDTATTEDKTVAVETIVESVATTTDVPLKTLKQVLGSAPFDPETGVATKEQRDTVEDYVELLESTEAIEDSVETHKGTAAVNRDVITGSKRSGFIGIKQHIANFQKAIALGQREVAINTIEKLQAFRQTQRDKLSNGYLPKTQKQLYDDEGNKVFTNYVPHSKTVATFIKKEIELLNNAINITKKEGVKRFSVEAVDIKPEPIVEKEETKQPKVVQTKEEIAADEKFDKQERAQDEVDESNARQEPADPTLAAEPVTQKTEAPGHVNILTSEYKELIIDLDNKQVSTIEEFENEKGDIFEESTLISKDLKRIDRKINALAFVFKECA